MFQLHTLEAVADANGAATASFTVPYGDPWRVTRMAATGGSIVTPWLLVYRSGVLIDTTRSANYDVSEPLTPLTLNAGEVLTAQWLYCTAGAKMQLTIEADA